MTTFSDSDPPPTENNDTNSISSPPIHDIPVELFTRIIEESEPENNILVAYGSRTVQLGMVCRFWRNVTISTPSLWSSITVPTIKGRRHLSLAAASRSLQLHLERSKAVSLSVIVDASEGFPYSSEAFTEIFDTLFQHAPRFRDLVVLTPKAIIERSQQASGRLTILESLTVYLEDLDVIDISLDSAPRLHTLTLRSRLPDLPQPPPIPSNRITTLRAKDVKEHLPTLLSLFPYMEVLSLEDCIMPHSSSPEQTSLLVLDQCHTFSFRANSTPNTLNYDIISDVFSVLSLPAALRVSIRDATTTVWRAGVLSMFLAGCVNLQELTLSGTIFPDTELIDALEKVPTLLTLTIHCNPTNLPSLTNAVIQALQISSAGQHCLLPTLRDLTISYLTHSQLSVQVLLDMIMSRQMPAIRESSSRDQKTYLRRVSLSTYSSPDAQRLRRSLQPCLEAMEILVELPRPEPGVCFRSDSCTLVRRSRPPYLFSPSNNFPRPMTTRNDIMLATSVPHNIV